MAIVATMMISVVLEEKVRGRFTIRRVTHPMPCFEPYPVTTDAPEVLDWKKTSGQIFGALCSILKSTKTFLLIVNF